MRIAFLLALLVGACLYTYWAFSDLAFLSRTGRLGPGFFPRIIGLAMIGFCIASIALDLGKLSTDDNRSRFAAITALVAVLAGVFVASLTVLGGTLAMAVFLIVTLSILNRGKHLQNLAVAILLPAAVYALFDRWLNASMPEGMLPIPI